ncbi:MAG: OmpA family protein [Candidatus Kapabacteria bacterium]|jgi:outer membrane protein OmpA-like peptidoglycan-associated protein|nr:OmpA family protein [Candidatus Kapabacteria bacterium]
MFDRDKRCHLHAFVAVIAFVMLQNAVTVILYAQSASQSSSQTRKQATKPDVAPSAAPSVVVRQPVLNGDVPRATNRSTNQISPNPVRIIAFDLGPGGKLSVQDSAFKVGSAALEPTSLPFFNALGEYLIARPDLEIEIRGHASSEGDAAKNMQLSNERAASAKQYLVQTYGILPSRIQTKGFGDRSPIKSNTDEKGRSQNRRVEIVGISSVTQKALTTETGQAAEGIGNLTDMDGKVQLRAPWELAFHNARSADEVHEYHRINTGENSRAEITFKDKSKIQISENTSMQILSPDRDRAADKPQENVRLIKGNLFVKLNGQSNAADKFLVKTDESAIEFDRDNAGKISVDSNKRATVSVFEGGNARVRMNSASGNDSTIEVESGFGFSMQGAGGAGTIRRIPATPELIAPDPAFAGLLAIPSPVIFQWQRRAPMTRLEIANDEAFTSLVYRHVFQNGDSVSMRLDSGNYYYRIASIDEYGIESKPIEGTLTVAGSGKSVVFRASAFIMFLLAIALIWGSILVNTPFQARYIQAFSVSDGNLQFDYARNANYLLYRLRNYTLDHRSLLLIMRSIAALLILVAMYIVW